MSRCFDIDDLETKNSLMSTLNMKNLFLNLLVAITTFATPILALASSSNGLILNPMTPASQSVAMFGVGAPSALSGVRPACGSATPAWTQWVIDLRTPGGRAAYATVLLAFSLGKTVAVEGTGTCDVWGDRESVNYLFISN
jgi:hypothetical protein